MKGKEQTNRSFFDVDIASLSLKLKLALILANSGIFIFILALFNVQLPSSPIFLSAALVLISAGVIIYSNETYGKKKAGVNNRGVWLTSITSRGVLAWLLGITITLLYIVLYFYPNLLGLGENGQPNTGLVALFDPLSLWLSRKPANQWFVYSTLYTLGIFIFGYKFMLKYKGNRYQQIRTISVMFFQLGFAFLIPELMARLNSENFSLPYNDFKNLWPLNYYNFEQYRVDQLLSSGNIGLALLILAVLSTFVISPILTYKYGKRWYCSWVCGCGGLAETAGDSFRHLSSKTLFSWKVERWTIHLTLVFVVIMTTAVIASYLGSDTSKYWLTKDAFLIMIGAGLTLVFSLIMIFKRKELGKDARYGAIGFFAIIMSLLGIHLFSSHNTLFFIEAETLRRSYGFMIGSIFSGVIGVGFYPIMGNRVWCRYGCPMAAILGMQQRFFSKFRITTNGGQCISCGSCSSQCEMGIDVRSYAQKGENIVRSSCVGCGICAAVCPRGVLKLENGSLDETISQSPFPSENHLGSNE